MESQQNISALGSLVTWLTRTNTKDRIKLLVGAAAALCGVAVAYDSIDRRQFVRWTAKTSLILGAATSWPGAQLIGFAMQRLYTDIQIQKAFGANIHFAGNPAHIRHLTSFISVGLALPIIICTVFEAFQTIGAKYKLCEKPNLPPTLWIKNEDSQFVRFRQNKLTDTHLAIMVTALTLFSRPVLHLGSQLARRVIAK